MTRTEYERQWREKNRDHVREYRKAYAIANRDKIRAHKKMYKEKTSEKWKSYMRDYCIRNKESKTIYNHKYYLEHKDEFRKYKQSHREANRPIKAAAEGARRALSIMAMPPWVKREEIASFYIEAKRRSLIEGVAYEVDHVWPLQGKGFVGLHVPWNLQVITAKENRRKLNHIP